MLGLGLALTNFGTKGGISDIADGGLLSSTFLSRYGPYGMVIDFTDASITINDSTDVLDYSSQGTVSSTTGALLGPGSKLTYTAPSAKLTEQADGYLAFQAHNLCLQSETFDNAAWTKTRSSVVADAIAGPTGTVAADKLIDSITSGTHIVSQTTTNGSFPYTSSVWAKAAELNFVSLEMSDNSTGSVVAKFNLATGALDGSITTGGSWTSSSATITAETNGWYKLTLTSTRGAGTQTVQNIGCYKTANTVSYAGTGTEGVYIFGAQLRRTPSVSTYVATTSAAVYDLPYVYSGGELAGIMVEPAATNLMTYSTAFSGGSWTATRSTVTTDGTLAPDGTAATKLSDNNSGGSSTAFVNHGVSVSASTAYTFSVYAKAGSLGWLAFQTSSFTTPGDVFSYFNIATGVVGTAGAGHTISISSAGNGWYRCRITFTTDGVDVAGNLRLFLSDGDGDTTIPLNGTNNIYIWGAQFETGTVATSPIITYGSSVVRALDLMYVPSSLFPYSATQAFLFAKMVRGSSTPNNRTGVSLNRDGTGGGTGDNISAAYWSNTTAAASWYASERTQTFSPTPVAGDTVKIAACFATSGTLASVSTQGQAVATSASSAWDGGSNRLYVGVMDATGLWTANDCLIKQIAYFPEYDTTKAAAVTA